MPLMRCEKLQKEDKTFRVLLFPSVHYVLRAEKILRKAEIRVDAIATPREFSSDCGISLLLRREDVEEALRMLKENALVPDGVYGYDG